MRSYPALEVSFPAPPEGDAVEGLVLAIIDEDHPLSLEERADGFRIYFASTDDRDRACDRIRRALADLRCDAIEVADEDWAARSQAGLAAVVVGGVIVCPPWDVQQATGAVTVIIQPSMGFGTGHHASTRLCLRLLQQLPHLRSARVVDVGTGSGVLAIAAAGLGARTVVATDSDADALQAAAENVALNDAGDRVELRHADLAATTIAGAPFDVVLANLTGGLLQRQARTLRALLAKGGALIISGIEAHEAPDVAAAFVGAGGRVVDRVEEAGWVGLLLRAD